MKTDQKKGPGIEIPDPFKPENRQNEKLTIGKNGTTESSM